EESGAPVEEYPADVEDEDDADQANTEGDEEGDGFAASGDVHVDRVARGASEVESAFPRGDAETRRKTRRRSKSYKLDSYEQVDFLVTLRDRVVRGHARCQ